MSSELFSYNSNGQIGSYQVSRVIKGRIYKNDHTEFGTQCLTKKTQNEPNWKVKPCFFLFHINKQPPYPSQPPTPAMPDTAKE